MYKDQYTKINEPSSMADLGHVDYMLIDKTGTLTTSYQKLECMLFGSSCFALNHDSLFKSLQIVK
jgi:P-type E1-E2 ATPase